MAVGLVKRYDDRAPVIFHLIISERHNVENAVQDRKAQTIKLLSLKLHVMQQS